MSPGWALTSFPSLTEVPSFSVTGGNDTGFAGLTEGLEDTEDGAGPPYMRTEGVGAPKSGCVSSVAFTHAREKEKVCLWGHTGTAESVLGPLWGTAVREVEVPQGLGKELEVEGG